MELGFQKFHAKPWQRKGNSKAAAAADDDDENNTVMIKINKKPAIRLK
jgi:hypothetical protein